MPTLNELFLCTLYELHELFGYQYVIADGRIIAQV